MVEVTDNKDKRSISITVDYRESVRLTGLLKDFIDANSDHAECGLFPIVKEQVDLAIEILESISGTV